MAVPQTIEVASVGMWDSLILMVMALVVLGPRRLPEIARQIGRLMYEIRKASNDFKFQMEDELRKAEEAERQKKESDRLAALPPAQPSVDSQIPKWEPGAPAQDPQFPTPSPYHEESVYPAISRAEYQPQETTPQIKPPSTGEQVPAARPGSSPESDGTLTPEPSAQPNPAPNPITEQARHG
jgi:sec-independent protein translocase protein TatB